MLPDDRRRRERLERCGPQLGDGPRKGDRTHAGHVDRLPVVAGSELRAVEHVGRRGDGGDQQAPPDGFVQQLGLGLRGEEVDEDPVPDPLVLGAGLPTVEQHHRVVDPVLVTGRRVAEPLLVDPFHELPAERTDGRTEHERDRDVAVGARPHQLDVEVAVDDAPGDPLRERGADRCGEHLGSGHLVGGLLDGHVRVLAEARVVVPLVEGDQRRLHRFAGPVVPGLRRGSEADRRSVLVPGQRQTAGRREQGEIGRRPARLGTGLPEGRDRDVHERVVRRRQDVAAQPAGGQRARRLVLEEHVGPAHEFDELRTAARRVEVDDDALLAPVVGPERQRPVRARLVTGEGSDVSSRRSPRRLDQDHLRAQRTEDVPRQLRAVIAQLDDPIAPQHPAPPPDPTLVIRPSLLAHPGRRVHRILVEVRDDLLARALGLERASVQ